MKKIGFIILSRYSSSRLPGKALININGQKLLGNIIGNLKESFPEVDCIVATSNEQEDDLIQEYCDKSFTKCFRGDLEDVSKRFLDCSIKNDLE